MTYLSRQNAWDTVSAFNQFIHLSGVYFVFPNAPNITLSFRVIIKIQTYLREG